MSSLSADTFTLLQDLSVSRDKAWFEANRGRYERHLLEPMRALVKAVAPALRERIPDLECRPQVNRTLTRIHRDMRFARGSSPYKDHMLALFYREGRKQQDPQLFVGLQPREAWVGLYLGPVFLGGASPMAAAVQRRPEAVVSLGREAGLGRDLRLAACERYGEVARWLAGDAADHYLAGPHLCALRVFTPEAVALDPAGFPAAATDLLLRLIPLRDLYLEGL